MNYETIVECILKYSNLQEQNQNQYILKLKMDNDWNVLCIIKWFLVHSRTHSEIRLEYIL